MNEKDYVFKEGKDCSIRIFNQHGDGGMSFETLYLAFKQRLLEETTVTEIPEGNRVR